MAELTSALLALAAFLTPIGRIEAVVDNGKFCYVCNSDDDFECFQPTYDTNSQKCRYGCYLRINKFNDGNTVVIRGCGSWKSLYSSGCTETSPSTDLTRTECLCKTDYCNNAVITPATEMQLARCYRCHYYASTNVEHVVDTTCLYPDTSTPTSLCPYGYCKKIYFKTGDYIGISRSCVDASPSSLSCEPDSTANVRYELCSCVGDLCNGAAFVYGETAALVVFAGFVSFAGKLLGLFLLGT